MKYDIMWVRIGLGTELSYGMDRLEKIVNERIMKGWIPQGGVHCIKTYDEFYITQAMILREEKDK